jgi:hypothetical protein
MREKRFTDNSRLFFFAVVASLGSEHNNYVNTRYTREGFDNDLMEEEENEGDLRFALELETVFFIIGLKVIR